MKFLFRSGWGESLGIARRVEQEGNLVRFSVVEPKAQQVGQGLITKTRDFPASVAWADVVVFDSNPFDMPKEAERMRQSGKPCLGSSALSGMLEHDRMKASDLAKQHGLRVSEFHRFQGKGAWREARKFLADVPDDTEWVWKQNGDGEIASTFVETLGYPEMERMLRYLEGLYANAKKKQTPDFVLCEKIKGIEVSTEAWFNGKDWTLANNTIEKNRFFPGDLGEKTGCAGNIVWAYEDLADSRLFEALLKPLTPILAGKYNGPVDVNALIDEDSNEPLFLEFTPRFGYDAIFALAELVGSALGGLISDCARGRSWKGRMGGDGIAGAIRIDVPPYPEEESDRSQGLPIFGFDPAENEKGVWPCEVMLDDHGEPVTSGPNGYVFVLTATADSPEAAMKACFPDKSKLKIPLMRYRTDLPEVLAKCYRDLTATGWVQGSGRRLFGR